MIYEMLIVASILNLFDTILNKLLLGTQTPQLYECKSSNILYDFESKD